ncbi:MAG: hypothetical protein HQL40_12765 [Alphaproteobacteria bacterium]|nr:hypothetical protein [Alphaproteobacteria bacterium]
MFGGFMLGARSRLLPPSLPFGFFGAAVAFHVAGWAALTLWGDGAIGFQGGLGPALGALHLFTLGVLVSAAMGASFQLLPVATKRPLRSLTAARVAMACHVLGTPVLAWGMVGGEIGALHAGGALVGVGLFVFLLLLADNLRRVDDLPLVTGHAWVAVASLAAFAALGLLLTADFTAGILPDHGAAGAAHAVAAGFGFMGMLIFAFSPVLVPMFALSPPVDAALGRWSLRLAAPALALGVAGALFGWVPLVALAGLLGLGAAAAHLKSMALVMKSRMKRNMGDSFVLIRGAWACLPVSLALGLAFALDVAPEVTGPLFGWFLVFGWLLSFLMGVLQRILPFLASMHSVRPGIKPVLVSALTLDSAARAHLVLHFAALALGAVALAGGWGWLMRLAATLGLTGALAFALFAVEVWRRMNLHLSQSPQVPEKQA